MSYAAVQIKSGYYRMPSSWISTARNNIADSYDGDCGMPLERRVTPFFASQILRFIHLHFFNKSRIHNAGHHDWLIEKQTPSSIVYVVTALHHALQEWRKSGGDPPPSRPSAKTGKVTKNSSAGWCYFFSLKNDGLIYSNAMCSWNSLDHQMQERAVMTIRNALKIEIRSATDEDDRVPVAHTTSTREFDPALMEAFLAEPIPADPDLGPLVMLNARKDIPEERDIREQQEEEEEEEEGVVGWGGFGEEYYSAWSSPYGE
ncbi:hypothetical protein BZA05DRAFT_436755 [Tricharina praecox]|uniref:uncharacterized protein n=1 Tax=Tricharina praecox TaxID=43433 RepID=UPI0022202A94|nr:uncharacterized protein BZA05DRAFT_436755 [Tricharina praecox]KAI5850794.1 hypothetical protein BZA05DRAFT_436755 [Tricharina praecox]